MVTGAGRNRTTVTDFWLPVDEGHLHGSWFWPDGSPDPETIGVVIVPSIVHEEQTAAVGLVAAAFALFGGAAVRPDLLVPIYALAGLAVGAVTIVPTMMVRAFPADVRFSGVSFAYNTAYAVFGAATPPLTAYLARLTPLGPAFYVAAATLVGAAAVLVAGRTRP